MQSVGWFPCKLTHSSEYQSGPVLIVAHDVNTLPESLDNIRTCINKLISHDAAAKSDVTVQPFIESTLIFSPVKSVSSDYDDVRRYSEAALAGIKRAIKAGISENLSLYVQPCERFPNSVQVALLGALEALYISYDLRASKAPNSKLSSLNVLLNGSDELLNTAKALFQGLIVSKDIGGGDPEMMAPPRMAKYVETLFRDDPSIKITVENDKSTLQSKYPLLAAVDRAAIEVPRHAAQIVTLEYNPSDGNIERTLFLVGKGVSMDTGGLNIKIQGLMRGMAFDKCGAGVAAGVVEVARKLKVKGVKVIARLCCVRNSVSATAYSTDEIVTGASGLRVRVLNTDAEGRMAMADPLFYTKNDALNAKDPTIITIATLTGHAIQSFGEYTVIMANEPAQSIASQIYDCGEFFGDPMEVSRLRREDFDATKGVTDSEDIMQIGPASRKGKRGHQFAAAFLTRVSTLDGNGNNSEHPIPYVHLDIAGVMESSEFVVTGRPVVAISETFFLS